MAVNMAPVAHLDGGEAPDREPLEAAPTARSEKKGVASDTGEGTDKCLVAGRRNAKPSSHGNALLGMERIGPQRDGQESGQSKLSLHGDHASV